MEDQRWSFSFSVFRLSIRQIRAIRGEILRVLCAKPSLHARAKDAKEFLHVASESR